MNALRNMKIGTRFVASFAAVLSLMIALTVIGIDRVNRIEADLGRINDVNSVKQRYAINFRGSVHDRAVTANIAVVTRAAAETGTAAGAVLDAADGLGRQSRVLMERVDGFVARIRQG